MINPALQVTSSTQPWEIILAANAKNRNYENCIEFIRNVNNAKPKTCLSYSLTKLGGFGYN